MEYMVYRLRFFTGVHFGNGSLGTSGIIGPGRHVVFRFVSGGGSFIRSGGARHVS